MIVTCVLAASCGGSSGAVDTSAPSGSTAPTDGFTISWKPCVDSFADGSECGTMKVPFDYSDPGVGTFTLALRRRPAQVPSERIGSLPVKQIITTDSAPIPEEKLQYLKDKLTVISIAPLLGEVIRRAHEGRSVGEMFNE